MVPPSRRMAHMMSLSIAQARGRVEFSHEALHIPPDAAIIHVKYMTWKRNCGASTQIDGPQGAVVGYTPTHGCVEQVVTPHRATCSWRRNHRQGRICCPSLLQCMRPTQNIGSHVPLAQTSMSVDNPHRSSHRRGVNGRACHCPSLIEHSSPTFHM